MWYFLERLLLNKNNGKFSLHVIGYFISGNGRFNSYKCNNAARISTYNNTFSFNIRFIGIILEKLC